MARDLGMSVSGFHYHFKSVTAMSPVQFQKQIRLQEARRMMLGENLDVASASSRVGYEDPSYFSREYKKLFGAPPQGDIASLRSRLEENLGAVDVELTADDFRQIENITSRVEVKGARYSEGAQKLVNR
jgi:AraC-like DNA-binding protein